MKVLDFLFAQSKKKETVVYEEKPEVCDWCGRPIKYPGDRVRYGEYKGHKKCLRKLKKMGKHMKLPK